MTGLFDEMRDPVGAIEDAGACGISGPALMEVMGWTYLEMRKAVDPLVKSKRIACHLHGRDLLLYAPEHKGRVLSAIQSRLFRRRTT